MAKIGTVFLVGAGPGDVGLITVRGKRLLESADAIVYDNLANDDLMSALSVTAERYYVGKKAGGHTLPQAEISKLLADLAAVHQTVVRLKGGDPYIFGRGGEEAELLASSGIPFEIVPGVTSAQGAAVYAGVPLTHRKYASSVAFLTGHASRTADSLPIDWGAAARLDTLVIYMGVSALSENMDALLDAGRRPDDEVIAVEWATYPRQRVLKSTISKAARDFANSHLETPAVLIIGRVCALSDDIDWFKRRPLFGKRILVTRAQGQASRLSLLLFQSGATPVEVPAIEIRPVDGDERLALERALSGLSSYQWVVFTSPNGVKHTFRCLSEIGGDSRAFGGVKLAAIGTNTAAALATYGLKPDLLPDRFQAEGLLDALRPKLSPGDHVAILRAREARATLVVGLREAGITVSDIPTYFSRAPDGLEQQISDLLNEGVDLLTFASPSAVKNLVAAAGSLADRLTSVPVAAIGPITRKSAVNHGFNVVVQPERFLVSTLVEAIAEWAEQEGSQQ